MANGIYAEIKKKIELAKPGTIFLTSDFTNIATATTVRKYLGRQVEEKNIRRIINGVYQKPIYSKLLKEYIPANPDAIAYAIARSFHWTIAPCGDVALNKLGLSTQVPVVWSYISDGPYRNFSWDNITLSFKHRANREISFMSETTTLVVEALRTLGKERIDDNIILSLKNKLPKAEKKKILEEATGVREWIYALLERCVLTEKSLSRAALFSDNPIFSPYLSFYQLIRNRFFCFTQSVNAKKKFSKTIKRKLPAERFAPMTVSFS